MTLAWLPFLMWSAYLGGVWMHRRRVRANKCSCASGNVVERNKP